MVGRTTDEAPHYLTNEISERHLFYAVLMCLTPVGLEKNETSHPDTSGIQPNQTSPTHNLRPSVLVKGPAIPYFSPLAPSPDPSSLHNKTSKISFSSDTHRNKREDEEKDIKECKEKAIVLLMAKLDSITHAIIDRIDHEDIEVWEDRGWKFAPVPVPGTGGEGMSVISGKEGKRDSWFPKGRS